jgi:Tfp pilus assembly PilM family ATPase
MIPRMRIPPSSRLAAPGPVGIDPGEGVLRLVQLVRNDAGVTVRASAAQTYVPGGENTWQEAISRAFDADSFVGRGVVAALPNELLHVGTVRIPASVPNASISTAASVEAATLFPFPLTDAVVQCLPAGDTLTAAGGDLQREVVVLAAPRQRVDALVDDLHAAGVIVESLDAGPCALFRAARPFQHPSPAANVLLEIGQRQTHVVIGRGSAINFIKSIDVGAWHFDEAVARTLNVAPAEARQMRWRVAAGEDTLGDVGAPVESNAVNQAVVDCMRGTLEQLSRNLALYLKYHAITFRGPGPQCIHLMGPEADNQMLREALAGGLGLPVMMVDPFSAFSGRAPPGGEPTGGWSLATGLALKKLPGRGQLFDLPPGHTHEAARA